jgi:hypothetical protein
VLLFKTLLHLRRSKTDGILCRGQGSWNSIPWAHRRCGDHVWIGAAWARKNTSKPFSSPERFLAFCILDRRNLQAQCAIQYTMITMPTNHPCLRLCGRKPLYWRPGRLSGYWFHDTHLWLSPRFTIVTPSECIFLGLPSSCRVSSCKACGLTRTPFCIYTSTHGGIIPSSFMGQEHCTKFQSSIMTVQKPCSFLTADKYISVVRYKLLGGPCVNWWTCGL